MQKFATHALEVFPPAFSLTSYTSKVNTKHYDNDISQTSF